MVGTTAHHNVFLAGSLGRVVQVDPITRTLKPPGTNCLKLKCDMLHSTSAFKFNLRRYSWGGRARTR